MATTVYKILLDDDENGLISTHARGKYTMHYKPGEKVDRPNLFVFLDLEDAESYGGASSDILPIWECETESEPRPAPYEVPDYDYTGEDGWLGVPPNVADKLILAFWEQLYTDGNGPLRLISCPNGAHLVDDVTLLRRVY